MSIPAYDAIADRFTPCELNENKCKLIVDGFRGVCDTISHDNEQQHEPHDKPEQHDAQSHYDYR